MTLDALLKVKPRTTLCVVGATIAGLPEKYSTALNELLNDRDRYSGRLIAKAMNDAGLKVSVTSVIVHRRGDCGCQR